ncbi:MAG TPA: DUF5667 domain-containing protein [Streptomyces sp.]|nr:DUF5667 domain-containing protein [Streptomyces sp.]
MRLSNRAAERFQHALDGERPADAEAESLLATSRMLSAVDTSRLAPREEFVHALRERLMAEAETMPALSPAAAQTAAARRAAARTTPVVLVMGRGLPRLLAGAAASVLAVGAVVGVASRSALPGSALYPVKGWLDSVAVQMAGSDYERGLTHLAQAQEHISDTRALSEQQGSEPGEFIEALDSAVASVRSGQRDLNTAFDGTGNPQALIAIRDFSARALPQVEALRPEVPAAALPALRELQALLEDSQTASVRRLAACAPSCALVSQPGAGPSQLPVLPSTTAAPGGATPGATLPGGVGVPSTPVTANPGGGLPGVTAGTGGVTVGGDNGGATLSTDGATLNGPSVTASVPGLPPVTATLPSASISSSSVGVTVPTTLGGISLPGAGAPLPLPKLP